MGLFERLFFKQKDPVTSRDLKIARLSTKRKRRKKQLEMRKMAHRRDELVERVKEARREGNNLEVDYLWEEMKANKVEMAYGRREAKILNFEYITLTRYLRAMERLEKNSEVGKIQELIRNVQRSGLEKKLYGQELDEAAYLDELNSTLEFLGDELEAYEDVDEDPAKNAFLAELDEVIAAEEEGDLDKAIERETELKSRLDEEETKELGL